MEILQSVFEMILSMAWSGTLVILVVILVRQLLGRAPRWISYALWLVVAFKLLCPVGIPSNYGLDSLADYMGTQIMYSVQRLAAGDHAADDAFKEEIRNIDGQLGYGTSAKASEAGESEAPAQASETGESGTPAQASETGESGTPAQASETGKSETPAQASETGESGTPAQASGTEGGRTPAAASGSKESETSAPAGSKVSKASDGRTLAGDHKLDAADILDSVFCLIIWLAGILFLLGYSVYNYVHVRRCLRFAIKNQELSAAFGGEVYECEGIRTPFVLGLWTPVVYLPLKLSDILHQEGGSLELILRHEMYHIRRRDHLVKPFAFVLACVYWFHPLVWLAYILMGRDMEMSCDEHVLAASSMEQRAAYSRALLTVASGHRMPTPCPLAFAEGGAKGRIRHVLQFGSSRLAAALAMALAVTTAAGCMFSASENAPRFGLLREKSQLSLIHIESAGDTTRLKLGLDLARDVNSLLVYEEEYIYGSLSGYKVLLSGQVGDEEGQISRQKNLSLQHVLESAENGSVSNYKSLAWHLGEESDDGFTTESRIPISLPTPCYNGNGFAVLPGAEDEQSIAIEAEAPALVAQDTFANAQGRLAGGTDISVMNSYTVRYYLVVSKLDEAELCQQYEVSKQAQTLYALKNPYVGDASANGRLLGALGIAEDLGVYYTMQLYTSKEPYAMELRFEQSPADPDSFDQRMTDYAKLLLALIDNLSSVNWSYTYIDVGEEDPKYVESIRTMYYSAEHASEDLGQEVKSCGESLQKVQWLLDQISASRKSDIEQSKKQQYYTPLPGQDKGLAAQFDFANAASQIQVAASLSKASDVLREYLPQLPEGALAMGSYRWLDQTLDKTVRTVGVQPFVAMDGRSGGLPYYNYFEYETDSLAPYFDRDIHVETFGKYLSVQMQQNGESYQDIYEIVCRCGKNGGRVRLYAFPDSSWAVWFAEENN